MPSKITEQHQPCPSCPSTDAYCLYDDGHGFCYSCQKYFPPNKETFDTLSDTFEYLQHRGLTKETLRHFGILTKVDKDGKPVSVGFPYPGDNEIKVRSLAQKTFEWAKPGDKSKVGLFGRDKFDAGSHKYITITEGEYDAASIYQVVGGPAVSVQSSSSAKRDCVVDFDFLNSFERIYLAFDGDAPGRAAAAAVARLFDPTKVFVVRFTTRKDANDFLQHGEEQELKNIWWNSRKFVPENVKSTLAEFEEILKTKTSVGFPYPFKTLSDMTYGLRTGEVVLLTAQEKVGKTSIMREIMYKILTETDHAVGAFFLEETQIRLLQALAGRHLRRPVHLPDCAVTVDELNIAMREVVVSDDRLHVYSHFGADDPDALLDTIRFLVTGCGVKYLFFDHIGMAVIGRQGRSDERQALEYLATRLEMMVKELDFSLIMVSHLNDFGQTRGSHYLTKVADITIQAMRNPLASTELERNTIMLQIPYNRFCAKSGPAGALRLNPETYVLEEVFDVIPANDNSFPVALGKSA